VAGLFQICYVLSLPVSGFNRHHLLVVVVVGLRSVVAVGFGSRRLSWW
jgi:hypothetical protein